MRKFQHSSCNAVLGAPPGHDQSLVAVEALAITRATVDDVPVVLSFWKPNSQELARLMAGRAVVISILGMTHPPLKVDVAKDD
jgi:hypothetical protein